MADADLRTSSHELRVRFFETDLMAIVHHAAYLTYFEAGRVEWLRARGVTYADWASRGVHLPVVEANVRYRLPARFDDLLTVVTTLADLRTVSLRFEYVLRRGDEQLATGWTRLGCVDDHGKIHKIPPAMRDVMLAGEVT
jgi:acyl-CoA thioester hydrolase